MEYVFAAYVGAEVVSSVFGHKSAKRQNDIAAQYNAMMAKEIARQRKLEENRQRRENLELMNSVSNLTNVAWSGSNAPTMSFDKYGDMG